MIAKTITIFGSKPIFGVNPKLGKVMDIILVGVVLEIGHETFHDMLEVLQFLVVEFLAFFPFKL
jgi:hypothetical protein